MIHMIAAVDKNMGIGRDNHLLCHLSDDLKRFKRLTMGHTIIMGRKTFESLPGVLPGRRHIVVTRQKDYGRGKNIAVYHTADEVCRSLQEGQDYFIIGGASMYKEFLPKADSMYLTEIDAVFSADTYFPYFDSKDWHAAEVQNVAAGDNKYSYRFVHYIRKDRANI